MERVLVSACLLGCPCRYDGQGKMQPWLLTYGERVLLVPLCPEQLGGLSTPRAPCECRGERVVSSAGADVTDAFYRGGREALRLAQLLGCRLAILQDRSPSCGVGWIYDGSFSGRLTPGYGVAARLLAQGGISTVAASQGEAALAQLLAEEKGKGGNA